MHDTLWHRKPDGRRIGIAVATTINKINLLVLLDRIRYSLAATFYLGNVAHVVHM